MSKITKLKICFLGDVAAPHLFRWVKYFAKEGHSVDIITTNPISINNNKKYKIHLLKKIFPGSNIIFRFLNLIPTLIQLRLMIKKINPDVIHAHSVSPYAYLVTLINFHPFIITPWGNDVLIDIKNSKLEKFLTKKSLERADLITCDGENTKNAMTSLGISLKKIKFITFGVDIKEFKLNLKKEILKNELFSTKSKLIISTRFLTKIHDVKTLIRSIPLVIKFLPDVKFLIVGNGPEYKNLIDLSKSLKIFDSIIFTGSVEENEMISLLQVSDIYVSTSLSESGLASSTAEGMACQLPIINTNTGDIDLWIKNNQGGFIIPIKNPNILAEKIIFLLKNDNFRKKWGELNRKIIIEKNNYYKEMKKMENIYKNIKK